MNEETSTPATTATTTTSDSAEVALTNDQLLKQELDRVSARYRRLLFWVGLAACWLLLAAGAAAALTWARLTGNAVPGLVLVLMFALPLVLVPILLSALTAVRNPFWIARRLEKRFMDLDERLLAAMEQAPDDSTHQLGFLQQTVIGEAVEHARTHRWERLVAGWKIGAARLAQFATLFVFVLIAGLILSDMRQRPSTESWWMGGIADRGDGFDVKVEPEDTSIERGASLLVLARFPERLPADVQLIYRDAQGEERQMPMSKSLDDPVFAGRVPSVNQDLTYAVRYGGDSETRWYKVSVFDYPNLEQADAHLKFPEYTGAPEKLVEDTRSVTAVEGTKATLKFRLNKPVADARLVPDRPRTEADAPEPVELTVDPQNPMLYSVALDMTQSQRYRLHLVDTDRRANKEKPDLVLNVVPNRAPDVKLAFPGRDVDVSPLQEMNVRAQVWDDFGIKRVGLSYAIAGQESKDVVLAEGVGAKEKRDLAHTVALEQLAAQPDQLLSYHLWVEDVAPDGNVRRTAGDMFFAEVRPFEEIFRQGEQPAGGEEQQQQQQQQGSQNAQEAEQLGELQKQIILATWKVMQRETSATPTELFVPDVKLLGESQASARVQAEGLEERLQDERSKGYLKNVLKHMDDAVEHLGAAADGPAIRSLAPALAAEQAAYAELLKLRAREHEVVRSNQRQQGQQSRSAGQQRRQQQMDQLDLDNEENRYETERQANPQQETAEQRETRQVLNRLRELAQRQEDLNRQMKELQLALEEARDEAQREELKRQLQRLRDQQQQNLRDTDELRDRMDRPENQQRMSDARQQLEESRENVRRASEALEQGMVPEAQSAGARASEQLNELREEFRKRTAGQFNEAMDQMRRDARELDQKQQELSQQMAEGGAAGEEQRRPPTLRDTGERQQIAQELQQQKERLEKLMEDMKRTVEEAENAEPLLSKQLYDAAREARQQQPERSLELTRQMLERGFVEEARREETEAGKAITQLREGVEQAAESVLGDEAEALRRARDELDALSQELEREMRRRGGGGDDPTTRPTGAGGDRLAQNQDAREGESGSREQPQGRDGQEGAGQQQREGQQARGGGQPGEAQEQQQQQQQQGGQGSQPSESAQANGESQSPSEQEGSQQGGQRGGRRQQQASSQQRGQGGQGGQRGEAQEGEQQQQQADARQQQQGEAQPGENEGAQESQRGGQRSQQARGGGGGGGLRRGGEENERNRGGVNDLERLLEGGRTGPGGNEELGPITGGAFRDWSDRLRDVEEMVGDPRLRAEAARIRERAREMRAEFNRHSKEPNWDIVRDFVSRPLVELRDKVAEELMRRQGTEALVPIDREPVPPEFAEQVRRYYERLGSGTR